MKRTNLAGPTFLVWKGRAVDTVTDPNTGVKSWRIGKLADALAIQTNDEYGVERLARSIAEKDGLPVYVVRLEAQTYMVEGPDNGDA